MYIAVLCGCLNRWLCYQRSTWLFYGIYAGHSLHIKLQLIILCKFSIRLRNIFLCDVHVSTNTIYSVTRIINCSFSMTKLLTNFVFEHWIISTERNMYVGHHGHGYADHLDGFISCSNLVLGLVRRVPPVVKGHSN